MIVRLSTDDAIRAASIGFDRNATAFRNHLTPRYVGHSSFWGGNIEGASAELAVSILTGLPWTGESWLWSPDDRVPPPDVGERSEVRWSSNQERPMLRLDKFDHDDRVYFLVTGFSPTYDVLGYLQGAEAKRIGRFREYPERSVWEVPPRDLKQWKNPEDRHAAT